MKPLVIGELTAKIPVIQGGMGVGISLSNLAGEVALNNCIGTISAVNVAYREKDFSAYIPKKYKHSQHR